jgi:hypothetical protein
MVLLVFVVIQGIPGPAIADEDQNAENSRSELFIGNDFGVWSSIRELNFQRSYASGRSWLVGVNFGTMEMDSANENNKVNDNYNSDGITLSHRWWFWSKTQLSGLYFGPIAFAAVKTLVWSGDGAALGTRSGYAGGGPVLGYQLVFKNGIGIDLGNEITYWTGYSNRMSYGTNYGMNYGITFGLGYAY